MTTPGKGRLGPRATVWVLALLFGGLAAFMFVPWPKRTDPEPAPVPYVKPPSKLAAYGLPDNPDFELLPEMFAKFADRGTWVNKRVSFAYWHPGAQRFAYFIEASRVNGSFRFREIPAVEFAEDDKESLTWPILFYTEVVDRTVFQPKSMGPYDYPEAHQHRKVEIPLKEAPKEKLVPVAPPLDLKSKP